MIQSCNSCNHCYEDGEFVYIKYTSLADNTEHIFLASCEDNQILLNNNRIVEYDETFCSGCVYDIQSENHIYEQISPDYLYYYIYNQNKNHTQRFPFGVITNNSNLSSDLNCSTSSSFDFGFGRGLKRRRID